MIGDPDDIRHRIRLTLPTGWFADTAPILDAILSGFAAVWSGLYQLIAFVVTQSRVMTATDVFLDMAARDLLSDALPRRPGEADTAFRRRVLAAMQRTRATRSGIVAAAAAAGYTLSVFEAAQAGDTGAYNVPTRLAWNVAGAWGSIMMPLESLAVATPGPDAVENELWLNVANATPAGGVVWLRVQARS